MKINSDDIKRVLIVLFRLISVFLALIALFLLYQWNAENVENKNLEANLSNNPKIVIQQTENENENQNSLQINFDELKKINSNAVAWIKINNTNINYPIVQYTDNSYYLTHNFENTYNSAGWIYLDYRNDLKNINKNTIVYGHNRRNDSMFSSLKNVLDPSWCDNVQNRSINFCTVDNNYIAEIFSAYRIKANDFSDKITFSSNEDYKNYLNSIISKSYYNFNTSVSLQDNILTLYTCDDNTNFRVIVHAKLVKQI